MDEVGFFLVVKTKIAEQSAEHFTRFTTNYCLKT